MIIKPVNRSTQFLVLLCLLALLLAGCSSLPGHSDNAFCSNFDNGGSHPVAGSAEHQLARNAPSSSPSDSAPCRLAHREWSTSSPEAQGMDSQKLAEMLAAIEQQHLNLHSLLIIRNGYLVSENYFGSYQPDTRHQLYSVTKSFIATLIGIALDKGYLDGTDQRIVDFFPERAFANLDEQKAAMTLDDTLTMRTGLDWQEGDPAYRALYLSPDWVKYVLDEPMIAAPGSQFNYCSGCSHVLSAVLSQTTGMNPRDFAEQYLFKPLGITNVQWDTDAQGIPNGGWGLQLTPRDMAKLGYSVSPPWTMGWTANRLGRLGGERHAHTHGNRWHPGLWVSVVDVSSAGRVYRVGTRRTDDLCDSQVGSDHRHDRRNEQARSDFSVNRAIHCASRAGFTVASRSDRSASRRIDGVSGEVRALTALRD